MSIGAGITMIVFGLILLLGVVQVDVPLINEYTLGVLLTLGGIAAIVFSLTLGNRPWGRTVTRDRTTHVVEQPPVAARPQAIERVVERRVIEREVDDPNIL